MTGTEAEGAASSARTLRRAREETDCEPTSVEGPTAILIGRAARHPERRHVHRTRSPQSDFGAARPLIGGGASLIAAVYTQQTQNRLQRVAGEVSKREAVYADFVMSASNLLLSAYVHDELALGGDEQHLIGLINRMRLFAPPEVVNGAEAVLRSILKISLEPSIELRRLAKDALSKSMKPDPLQSFSQICRADLDNVFRSAR